jgi:hypothetical protein
MKVQHCEYCGEDLGGKVDRYNGDPPVTCGKQECERWARDCMAEQREDAHRDLDDRMGW